ncbi:hypothetical protein RJ639_002124 [Escallonia herrerae]|uniref:Uncharacterized protein n=1 Tax=Escallonia herrerae TaxID=1293975 RepID=A0AA89BIF3_9ASTE|nr:hypothetical protein RJ639_002124 [Escallonia herrerae]
MAAFNLRFRIRHKFVASPNSQQRPDSGLGLMGQLHDRIDTANELTSLASKNDRNKKIIMDEGGIGPLLRFLKEGASPEAQLVAATALHNIGTDQESVRIIASKLSIPIVLQVLGDWPMRVQ